MLLSWHNIHSVPLSLKNIPVWTINYMLTQNLPRIFVIFLSHSQSLPCQLLVTFFVRPWYLCPLGARHCPVHGTVHQASFSGYTPSSFYGQLYRAKIHSFPWRVVTRDETYINQSHPTSSYVCLTQTIILYSKNFLENVLKCCLISPSSEFMAGFRTQIMYTSIPTHLAADCGNIVLFGKLTGEERRESLFLRKMSW